MDPVPYYRFVTQSLNITANDPAYPLLQKIEAQLSVIFANPASSSFDTWTDFSKSVRKLSKTRPPAEAIAIQRCLVQFLLDYHQLTAALRAFLKLPFGANEDLAEKLFIKINEAKDWKNLATLLKGAELKQQKIHIWRNVFQNREFSGACTLLVDWRWSDYLIQNCIHLLGLRMNETFVTPADFGMFVDQLLKNPAIDSLANWYQNLMETALARDLGDLAMRICAHLMAYNASTPEMIDTINEYYRAKGQSNYDALSEIVAMCMALKYPSSQAP